MGCPTSGLFCQKWVFHSSAFEECAKGDPMTNAGRWIAIALLVSCCGLTHAASTRTELGTVGLDGQLQTDLSRITNLRLHLRDGDFRIVGSDSSEITIHAD